MSAQSVSNHEPRLRTLSRGRWGQWAALLNVATSKGNSASGTVLATLERRGLIALQGQTPRAGRLTYGRRSIGGTSDDRCLEVTAAGRAYAPRETRLVSQCFALAQREAESRAVLASGDSVYPLITPPLRDLDDLIVLWDRHAAFACAVAVRSPRSWDVHRWVCWPDGRPELIEAIVATGSTQVDGYREIPLL